MTYLFFGELDLESHENSQEVRTNILLFKQKAPVYTSVSYISGLFNESSQKMSI